MDLRALRTRAMALACGCAVILDAPSAAFAQDCAAPDPAQQRAGEAECKAVGGEWAKFGVRAHLCGIYSCAPRTTDGGRPCRDRTDCEYLCVSRKPAALGTAVGGECAGVRSPFGCAYQVDGGKVVGYVCMD